MTAARLILFLLSLVLPVALWTGSTSYESPKFLLWSAAGATWLALAGVAAVRRRTAPAPPVAPVVAAASQVMVMAPGLWLAAAPALAARAVYWSVLWWLVVVAAMQLLRDARDRRRLVACGSVGAAAAGAVALLQLAGLAATTGAWCVPIGIGTLGNENFVTELAAIWLLPSLLLPAGARPGARRLGACAPTAVLLAVLVASSATGARVAALAAACLAATGVALAATKFRARAPLALGAALLAAALAAGLLVRGVLDPARDVARPSSLSARLFTANHGAERRTDWIVAARLAAESPLVGCGAGNYGARWLETRAALSGDPRLRGLADGAPPVTRAHNEYLQWAAETAWPGLAWLAAVVAAGALAWSRAWRRAATGDARLGLLLPMAGLAAAAVVALVSFPAHRPASGLAVALLAGVLGSAAAGGPRRVARPPRAAALLLPLGLAVGLFALVAFRADRQLAQGARLFATGDHVGAIASLEAGVDSSPWPGDGRLYLGLALAANQRLAEAGAALEASLRDRPSFEAPLALAELRIDEGRQEEAGRWLDLVESCAPPAVVQRQAGYLRAYALLRADRLAEAAAAFVALAATDRLDHRSRLGLGYARARMGDLAGAAAAYREAIIAIEEVITAPRPDTAGSRGELPRLGAQLEAARRALASVGG